MPELAKSLFFHCQGLIKQQKTRTTGKGKITQGRKDITHAVHNIKYTKQLFTTIKDILL